MCEKLEGQESRKELWGQGEAAAGTAEPRRRTTLQGESTRPDVTDRTRTTGDNLRTALGVGNNEESNVEDWNPTTPNTTVRDPVLRKTDSRSVTSDHSTPS